MFNRLDAIPERDTQTDRQTEEERISRKQHTALCIASRVEIVQNYRIV